MRAQSETVGVIALLGIVVVLVTTVGVAGLATIAPEDIDRTQATLVDLDVSLDAVSAVHAGGEPLPAEEVVVRIDHDGNTDVYRIDSDGTAIEGTFEPGDEWTLEAVPYGADATVDVHAIHEPTNTILEHRRAVFGDGGDGDDGGGDGV